MTHPATDSPRRIRCPTQTVREGLAAPIDVAENAIQPPFGRFLFMLEGEQYYPRLNRRPNYDPNGPSVYGEPDPVTLGLLQAVKPHGQVLEVGAGDGRYSVPMLEQGLSVIASDVDPEPLDILRQRAPKDATGALCTVSFDAFGRFPIPDESVNAVVCTAFLYLYPESYIEIFAQQARRVLKEKGKLIIDFVTDRRRLAEDGSEIVGPNEVSYDQRTGQKMLKRVLKRAGFRTPKILTSRVHQDLLSTAGFTMDGIVYLNPESQKLSR